MVKLTEEIVKYGSCENFFISTEIKDLMEDIVGKRYEIEQNMVSEECDRLEITGRAKAALVRKVDYNRCLDETIEEIITDEKIMKFFELKLKYYKENYILISKHSYPISYRKIEEEDNLFTVREYLPR